MSRIKPARVRYYVDADVLGLAKVLASLRADLTFPGDPGAIIHKRQRPPCTIKSPMVPDTDWIPEVARQGWLIITRDRHIKHHRLEIARVVDHAARMVVLTGSEAKGTWEQLEVVMCQWRAFEALIDRTGPFICAATRTRLRDLDLETADL